MRTIQFNQWYEIAKKSVQAALKSVYAKYFLILFAIFLVALIPLFRANFNYIDDLGRIREGYLNFGFGRYTSNIAATTIIKKENKNYDNNQNKFNKQNQTEKEKLQ